MMYGFLCILSTLLAVVNGDATLVPPTASELNPIRTGNLTWQVKNFVQHRLRHSGRIVDFDVSSPPAIVNGIPAPGFNVSCANHYLRGYQACDSREETGNDSTHAAFYLSAWISSQNGEVDVPAQFMVSQIFYSPQKNASYNITANFNADLSQSGVVFNFTISPTTMSETPTCQKTKTPCPPPSLEDAPDVIRNASMYEEPPDVFEYSWIVTNWNASPTVIEFDVKAKEIYRVSEDANVPALEGHCSGAAGPEQTPDASNPRSYTKCTTADPDIFVGFWFARPASRDACSAGKLGILFSWSWNLTWVYSWGSKKLTGGWNMTGAVNRHYASSASNNIGDMFSIFPSEVHRIPGTEEEA